MAKAGGSGGGGGGSMAGGPPPADLLGSAGAALLDCIPKYDYMTQIEPRMFEDKHVSSWPLRAPFWLGKAGYRTGTAGSCARYLRNTGFFVTALALLPSYS